MSWFGSINVPFAKTPQRWPGTVTWSFYTCSVIVGLPQICYNLFIMSVWNGGFILEKTAPSGVPRWIFIMIILILAAMYYYAAYVIPMDSELAVDDFYTAILAQDYKTAVDKLSVLSFAPMLPQFGSSPQEMVNNRAAVEQSMVLLMEASGQEQAPPANMTFEILSEYTQKGENVAVVVCRLLQEGEPVGLQRAILINEQGHMRILGMAPIFEEDLPLLKKTKIEDLDKEYNELFGPPQIEVKPGS